MAENLPIVIQHSRERLPTTIAYKVLETEPKLNLQHGRLFITIEEFEAIINTICFQLWKSQFYDKFVNGNGMKIN